MKRPSNGWLLAALLLSGAASSQPPVSNLIIGGGMIGCTSSNGPAAGPNCRKPWDEILREDPALAGLDASQLLFERPPAPPAFSYRIDAARIAALQALPAHLLSEASKARLAQSLGARLSAAGQPLTGLSRAALDLEEAGLGEALPAHERAALLHVLVEPLALPPTLPREGRKIQARSIRFASNEATQAIYREFVQAASALAGGKTPLIGVVTAAARNPFNDHDINVYALRSAGAEVVWLPADGGLRRAIDSGSCEQLPIHYSSYANTGANTHAPNPLFHMDQLFPDLARSQQQFCANQGAHFNATVQRLNGIFFSGGDQARLLESLVGRDAQGRYRRISEQLRLLQQRHAAGQLVVAGSSAGDSAQSGGNWRGRPVPMISGGESWRVLAEGFVPGGGPMEEGSARRGVGYADGGLGFFRFGPLDSHFSQRSREGRLLRFVKDSGMDYGFGVDENTALRVHQADSAGRTALSVVGAGGVFIVDVRGSTANAVGPFDIRGATVHYLHAGDRASIDAAGQLSVQLGTDKPLLPAQPQAPSPMQNKIQQPGTLGFVKLTQAMGLSGASAADGSTEGSLERLPPGAVWPSPPHFSLRLSRSAGTEFRQGGSGAVSYAHLQLAITPSGDNDSAAHPIQKED
ncbi:hypothetical protein BH11PSE10_BH11PSE10_11140 [soil metagenome]